MRPTSTGYLKLQSKDPNAHPIIEPNYLSTEMDRWELRESVKLAREIFSQKAFDEYRDVEIYPGPDVQTDDEIDEYARNNVETEYHPSCTCKMGDASVDGMTVVDNSARVVGMMMLKFKKISVFLIGEFCRGRQFASCRCIDYAKHHKRKPERTNHHDG